MKTMIRLFAAAAFLFLFPSLGNAHNDRQKSRHSKDTVKTAEHIIEISSLLTIKGSPAGEYDLLLSLDGKNIDTIKIEKARPIFFELEQGRLYGLVFKKEGYPDKIVMIDTSVPRSLKKSRYFNADIEIELDTEMSTHKKEFLDFPVAAIRFDMHKKKFDYSRKYYSMVHTNK